MSPPEYTNWRVCLYFWLVALMTNSAGRGACCRVRSIIVSVFIYGTVRIAVLKTTAITAIIFARPFNVFDNSLASYLDGHMHANTCPCISCRPPKQQSHLVAGKVRCLSYYHICSCVFRRGTANTTNATPNTFFARYISPASADRACVCNDLSSEQHAYKYQMLVSGTTINTVLMCILVFVEHSSQGLAQVRCLGALVRWHTPRLVVRGAYPLGADKYRIP